MNKFFRYSGTKCFTQYISKVNILLQQSNNNVYIEPFVGAGGILFNLNKEFDKYIINDIDRNIIRIYNTFKVIDYDYYINIVDNVFERFGKFVSDVRYCDDEKIREQKLSYYTFREWFNKKHWNTNTIEEGVYIHMLANSCINSFLRFSSNGMNQGYGLRFYYLKEQSFNHIKNILQKTEIYNTNYKDIFELYPNALYFLDPPYYSQDSSYSGFIKQDYIEFLELLKDKEFIYTDIINDYNKDLNYNKIFIRTMDSTAPSVIGKKTNNKEYIITTFKHYQNSLDELF